MKLPRFTLRDLFWLVLVCAICLGWGLNYLSNLNMRMRAGAVDRKLNVAREENKVLTKLKDDLAGR